MSLKLNTHVRRKDFFQGGGNSGYFHVVTKSIFQTGANSNEFHFTNSKITEKYFSTKKLIGKWKNPWGQSPPCSLLATPMYTIFGWIFCSF